MRAAECGLGPQLGWAAGFHPDMGRILERSLNAGGISRALGRR
jgi:hypothetical protein